MIKTVMEISTAHITKRDADRLEKKSVQDALPIMYGNEYGWMFYSPGTSEEIDALFEEESASLMTEEFKKLFKHVFVELGVDRLRLDRDAEICSTLARWDW